MVKTIITKFKNAFVGIWYSLHDKNIGIQVVFAVLAMIACWILKAELLEIIIVLLCISSVIVTEIINTCIEKTCDLIDQEYNEKIKVIKDMAASAVLVASIVSLLVAIFLIVRRI